MKLTRVHVDYWLEKQRPRWADRFSKARAGLTVHSCINAHAGIRMETDARNLIELIRGVARRGEDILPFLDRMVADPGTVINPGKRSAYARRWARRIRAARSQR